MPADRAKGRLAANAITAVPRNEARQVASSTAVLSIPACESTLGFTASIYAIVMNVVRPAASSVFTVVLFFFNLKIFSSMMLLPCIQWDCFVLRLSSDVFLSFQLFSFLGSFLPHIGQLLQSYLIISLSPLFELAFISEPSRQNSHFSWLEDEDSLVMDATIINNNIKMPNHIIMSPFICNILTSGSTTQNALYYI